MNKIDRIHKTLALFKPILDLEQGDSDAEESEEEEIKGRGEAELRREALTARHLLTHLPKNPFCSACQRAKAQRRGARRVKVRNLRKAPEKFGDETTADHWIAKNEVSRGYGGRERGTDVQRQKHCMG